MDCQAPALALVFPQEVSSMVRSQVKDGNRVGQKVKEIALTSIQYKTHIFCYYGSIGYFNRNRLLLRLANGGLVGAESNT